MRYIIYTVLVIGLVTGFTAETVRSLPCKGQRTQGNDVLIIDLSKRLPDNPYQSEYEKMLYPTVRIKAGFSTGSGVAIDDYILTAAHVVGDNSDARCELWDSSDEITATVLITDTIKDLAFLKPVRALAYKATLAPRDYQPCIFTPVYSVGCSLGYPPRPSNGIISVITDSYWEVTSPILPGNSGGPVFNANTYEVIGIAVWVQTYQGQLITTMAGVVPINEIYEFVQQYTDLTD